MNWDAVGTVVGGLLGIGNSAYNAWANKRDFDYQKSLQQQIFDREDTAVQRRMNDLKAAGLNPNLATGQAAQAGSVVSRSNTNDVDFGSAIDKIMAVNQIKQQKVQTENAKIEQDILKNQKDISTYERLFKKVSTDYETMLLYHKLGFEVHPTKDGYVLKTDQFGYPIDENNEYVRKHPLFDEYDANLRYLNNSNELLQKELNWYNINQVLGNLTDVAGAVTGGVNAGANLKRAGALIRSH